MNKFAFVLAAVAALALTGCEKHHTVQRKIYHFQDGRVGYPVQQDNSNIVIWYWLMFNNGSTTNPQYIYAPNSSYQGARGSSWSTGKAPTEEEEEAAGVDEEPVTEDANGTPETEGQVESESSSSTEGGGESSGGDSGGGDGGGGGE